MSGFTKLSSSILTSSIWDAPDSVRIVWITMLAMADQNGVVAASVGGIAHQARKTREETEAALAAFLAPDSDSKNPDNDGRRIERVTQGFRILNHHIYRELGMSESTKEYWRKKQQEHRSQRHVNDSQRHVCIMGNASAKEEVKGKPSKPASNYEPAVIPEALSRIEGFKKAWELFLENRRAKKARATTHAQDLLLRVLAQRPGMAIQACETAVIRNWTGIEWEWLDPKGRTTPSDNNGMGRSVE